VRARVRHNTCLLVVEGGDARAWSDLTRQIIVVAVEEARMIGPMVVGGEFWAYHAVVEESRLMLSWRRHVVASYGVARPSGLSVIYWVSYSV
jgi:hypothetical protein